MKRYTDEELSRILSEHEVGHVVNGGGSHERRCINQIAYNMESFLDASEIRPELMGTFDIEYRSNWSTDQFLAKLEEWGA